MMHSPPSHPSRRLPVVLGLVALLAAGLLPATGIPAAAGPPAASGVPGPPVLHAAQGHSVALGLPGAPGSAPAPAVVAASPPHPDELEALIAPYRDSLAIEMGEVLAVCPVNMRAGDPEGLLGALVCDIVLERAIGASGLPVDACVLNNGGLRASLTAGPVTLGQVYEIMPFDNEIVLLRFSGEEVRALADQIAAAGGEPVAGMSFTIERAKAAQLRIGPPGAAGPVADREYLVATSDYLASGGGNMAILWNRQENWVVTGVLVRDALIAAFRSFGDRRTPEEGAAASDPRRPGALRKAGAQAPDRGQVPVPAMGRIRSATGGGR